MRLCVEKLPLLALRSAQGTYKRVAQLLHVAGANREGDLHAFAQELPFDCAFQLQRTTVAADDHLGHGATITMLALPRNGVVGVGLQKPARFHILAAEVVAVKVPTIDRFIHARGIIPGLVPKCRAVRVYVVTFIP